MKKLLIATAAMAMVAGTAQAQSSVTIYGVMDAGVTTVDKTTATGGRVTGVTSGGLSTSRIGFKGTEDLGGGLSTSFTLETEVLPDTGTQGASTAVLFERGAFITLASKSLGSVSLGRQNFDEYATAAGFDPFGGNNIGGWVAQSQYGQVRFNNGVTLKSAAFNGLTVTYQHIFGEQAGDNSKGQASSLGANYTQGKFSASVIGSSAKDNSALKTAENTAVYLKYNAGFADFRAGHVTKGVFSSGNKTADQKGQFIGAVVPVTPKVNVMAIYSQFDKLAGAEGDDPKAYALGATYAMSKRTTLYAMGAKSKQESGSVLQILSTSKYAGYTLGSGVSQDQTAMSLGLRHTF